MTEPELEIGEHKERRVEISQREPGLDPTRALDELCRARDKEEVPAQKRAALAASLLVFVLAAELARHGTMPWRVVSGALLVGFALLLVAFWLFRKRPKSLELRIQKTIALVDAPLGARAIRASKLTSDAGESNEGISLELAELHFSRLIAKVRPMDVASAASGKATRWSVFGLVVALLAAASAIWDPLRVIEGYDVLFSRRGLAPLSLPWLSAVDLSVKPPDYLHEEASSPLAFAPFSAARGSVLTLRGKPLETERLLVLSDGKARVPFVEDGSGNLVARWTLAESASLFVAAEFGSTWIPEARLEEVTVISDEAPKVELEGAPRTVRLLEEPSVSLRYDAKDDHGLREVNLVLRSAGKEERRLLSRPPSDAKSDRGGYEIRATDPFIKSAYAPVEVTVEARDNDGFLGPKWGKSSPFLLLVPALGEPEAMRVAALAKARDAVTKLLGERLRLGAPNRGGLKEHQREESLLQEAALSEIESLLDGNYGGLSFRGRIRSLVQGKLRRLGAQLHAEAKATNSTLHEKLVGETEDALLALDAALAVLGTMDTKKVSRRLAPIADELASTFEVTMQKPEQASLVAKADALLAVLDGGGKSLRRLGELGDDLGEIVANDLRRIVRARETGDFFHATLAAQDLAARLRRPDPSFGGGSSGHGTEAGGTSRPDEGPASEAEQNAMQLEQELERIAQEHATEMNDVEQALERAEKGEELEKLKEEARKHAEAVRQAVRGLPQRADDDGSVRGRAARARERAEAMAGSLESGSPKDALESGKAAIEQLAEAKKRPSGGDLDDALLRERVGQAQAELEEEVRFLEKALENLRRAAQANAKEELRKSGEREEALAERTRRLAEKGESGDASLPQETLDHLKEAERAMREARKQLERAEGDEAQKSQKHAQRLLEMAQGEREQEESEPQDKDDGQKGLAQKTEVPGKEKHKGPEEFRKRVLEGLSKAADPTLREAVKRYAEGLLK